MHLFRRGPAPSPRVLSIIVNYNGGEWVLGAVESLVKQATPTDVLVVDNSSTDQSASKIIERFAADPVEVLLTGRNDGAAAGYNYALNYPDYDYYFFLNPDAYAPSEATGTLAAAMDAQPDLGVLGPAIVDYSDPETVQEFAPKMDPILFPIDRYANRPVCDLPRAPYTRAFYACAAAMMVRSAAFRLVGGCDSDYFMFVDEADLSWRLRLQGYETAVTSSVRVRHVGGAVAQVGMSGSVYRTSLRRIYLRERNCMITALKCFSMPTLILYLFLNTLHLFFEGCILSIMGKGAVAKAYYQALQDVWNSRAKILEKRRHVQRTRTVGEFEIMKNFDFRWGKLRALRERGVPQIVGFTKSS